MRAAIYARQSLDRSGEGLAVARQLEACRELIDRNGWTAAREYVDNDVSASSRKPRPEWAQLLADLDGGSYDVLVCWHTDRLYRRVRDLVDVVEIAERRALRIASVRAADLDLSTPAGRMLAGMLGHAQRYEVEQKSARQVAANQQRARAGRMGWTRRPYGYTRGDDGTVAVVETEAENLRDAARRVLAGQTLASIVRDLNSLGEGTSLGGPWTVTSLRRAILNPRLAGRVTYNGDDIGEGDWTTILDGETQERVAAVLRSPARRTQVTTTRKYLLSGTARCGVCGERMFASTTGSGVGRTKYMAYRCRVPHLTRRLDLVDEVVEKVVVGRLSRPDAAALLAPDVDLDGLRAEATELRARLDDLAQLLADGLLTTIAVREQATKLKGRLADAEGQIAAGLGSSPAAALAAAEDVAATWNTLDVTTRRQIVDELIVVTILPAGKGQRFDPRTVEIAWRAS